MKYLLVLLTFSLLTHFAPLYARSDFAAKSPPSAFIENRGQVTGPDGQIRRDIDFKLKAGNALNLFIGKGALHYQWAKAGNRRLDNRPAASKDRSTFEAPIVMYRMDVCLLGVSGQAYVTSEAPLLYKETYYWDRLTNGSATASSFAKIIYHEVYPNIDWVLYFDEQGKLEHDFIIRPGGKVSDISIHYSGATRLEKSSEGGLLATTPLGRIDERAPIAYCKETGLKVPVHTLLHDDTISFTAGHCDGTLIIDPVIDWSSYFGGIDNDFSSAVTTDKEGFIYMTGGANSLNNIVTTGAFQTTYGGGSGYLGNDAFLSKFDSTGTCLWSTYYGGTEEESALDVKCDTSGSIYFAGYTNGSTGLATTGAFMTVPAGGYDAFLVKFNNTGQRLWATYFGGGADDCYGGPVALASDGSNIYLTGSTQSSDLATVGAAQPSAGGSDDAFVAKFNSGGSLAWATYFGGPGSDLGYAIATDNSGNVLLTGNTNSQSGIAGTGSYQPTNAGDYDAFFVKYNSSGQKLWSTYFGGSNAESGRSITADDSLNIYVSGITSSTSGIAGSGSWQPGYGGGSEDAFLAKFLPSGSLGWATYYGGPDMDEGLCVRSYGASLLLSGMTASGTGVSSPDAFQSTIGGSVDGFISKWNANGIRQWSSYFGGVDWDQISSVAKGGSNDIFFCGYTLSGTGIATPTAHQPAYGGGDGDGLIGRIKDCTLPQAPSFTSGDTVICAGSTALYGVASIPDQSYIWTLPSGWQGISDSASINVTAGTTSGAILVQSVNGCGEGDTTSFAVTVNPSPDIPLITTVGNTLSVAAGYTSYQWMLGGMPIAGATNPTLTITANGIYTVAVTNEYGCSAVSLPYTATTTGIIDPAKSNVYLVYPNPASDYLFITSPGAASVNVYAIDGRLILSAVLKRGVNQIRTANWDGGMYQVSIYDGKGGLPEVQKIIIVKDH